MKTFCNITDLLWFQEGPGVRKHQYTETGVKLLNVANLVDGNLDLSTSDRYISEDEAYGKYKHFFVNEGDLIIASSGIQVSYFDKKMGFVKAEHLPLCMNTSTIRFKSLDKSMLDIRYFMYYLKSFSFKKQLAKFITGSAQLNFGPSHLKKMTMPLYAIQVQESIVRELDAIHGILEKKQEQLRELDNLAQAIFYEMFGDPITNPKQWEVKKLGELFDIGSSKRVYQSEWTTSGVPFYRAREVVKLARDGYVDNELFITEELYDKYAEKYGTPKVGDILVTAVGTLGVTYIVKEKDRFYYKDGNIICLHHKGAAVESKYVDFCFKTPFVREQIDNWSGATVGTFTIVKANTTILPLPPLSLQQSFAAKIEAIEAQKQAVQQSIREVEALLAERMDNYFG